MYEFTSDWFKSHVPIWKHLLSHLKEKPCRCLEIGTHEGRSAIWIAENLLSNGGSLTCVDPWRSRDVEARFDRNLASCARRSQISKLKGFSWAVTRTLPLASYDFVYIDGSHEGRHVLEDAVLAFRLLRKHGIIIFDDYRRPDSGQHRTPRPAIDAFLDLRHAEIEVLHHEDQVAIRRRN
jgi:predicted O-methyltransferase YrrM